MISSGELRGTKYERGVSNTSTEDVQYITTKTSRNMPCLTYKPRKYKEKFVVVEDKDADVNLLGSQQRLC